MRRVTALDVRCPACGVGPGARCRRLDDLNRSTAPHDLRREAARQEQQRINPEHVVGQLDLIPMKDVPQPPTVFVCSRGRSRRPRP